MAILIDPPRWPAHGRLWSHLVSDTSLAELHDFAAALGVPARGFEGDHYDVPEERYAVAVAAGARPVDGRTLLRALQASGLRLPKRKGERVLSSRDNPPGLPPGSRLDVVVSWQDNPPPQTVEVRLALVRSGRLLVTAGSGRTFDLPHRTLDGRPADLALAELQRATIGGPAPGARLVGYVRQIVPIPAPDYPWPVPRSCFVIYRQHLDPALETRSGRWLSGATAALELGGHPWWPLFAEGLDRYGPHD